LQIDDCNLPSANLQSAIFNLDLQSSLVSLQFPSRFLKHTPQQELDLAVQAAQIVVCPALNGIEDFAVHA